MTENWSYPTTFAEACRRAAGRRHYNAVRKFLAEFRRAEVAKRICAATEPFRHGILAEIARELGVSRSTVCRDMKAMLQELRETPGSALSHLPPQPERLIRPIRYQKLYDDKVMFSACLWKRRQLRMIGKDADSEP